MLISFVAGFVSLFLLWYGLSFWMSFQNGHLLANRISTLILKQENSFLLVLITALIGGIVPMYFSLVCLFVLFGEVVVWEFFVVGILFFLRREMGILRSPVPDLCCGRPTTRPTQWSWLLQSDRNQRWGDSLENYCNILLIMLGRKGGACILE